ncbi:transposon ty3-g Gag-Pol polyprotein [Plakobranchus ocellatus]|uniref:Transposon ty3-g Gag-Pol polyprotein n=1 Tax=Plakobranchus ocellatus TaxID=259542 RepID=A0AAV4DBL2_9GAST|nr:transposon ty3-g Gag-Pol polyprotein [Plakobranchus ocellatus]
MLAVVFGVEKFHIYLYGSTFTVITDHKLLLGIIGSCKPTSVRIDRWRLRLMPYQFTMIYRPDKDADNPADYLSRHPTTKPLRHNDGENYVNYVANASLPNALSLREVRKKTKQDRVLVAVMTSISTGNWDSRLVSQFQFLKDELTIHDGIILRQHRIVIPESLRLRVIKLAHSAHQSVVKTKQLLREKIWFPVFDKLVESGPFPSGDYLLIVIDDYSKFPEVEIVKSTSAHATIQSLYQCSQDLEHQAF